MYQHHHHYRCRRRHRRCHRRHRRWRFKLLAYIDVTETARIECDIYFLIRMMRTMWLAYVLKSSHNIVCRCVLLQSDYVDNRFWLMVGVQKPTSTHTRSHNDYGNASSSSSSYSLSSSYAHSSAPSSSSSSLNLVGTKTPPHSDQYSDIDVAYDLVLSDGRFKMKVVLSPSLNIYVEKGELQALQLVDILSTIIRFDETASIGGQEVIVVQRIDTRTYEEKLDSVVLVSE